MKPESIKPIYDPWNPSTWPLSHVVWWAFFLLNMVFVWLTPLNVLDRYPQLVPFTDFMASWNTQIRHLGEYSGPANQANRFCSSVFWCVMPLLMSLVFFQGLEKIIKGSFSVKTRIEFLKILAILPLGFYMFWIIPNYPVESSRIGRSFFVNPIGRGFFLPAITYIPGITAFAWCILLQSFLRGKLVTKGGK